MFVPVYHSNNVGKSSDILMVKHTGLVKSGLNPKVVLIENCLSGSSIIILVLQRLRKGGLITGVDLVEGLSLGWVHWAWFTGQGSLGRVHWAGFIGLGSKSCY